jgi:hypothetical protein
MNILAMYNNSKYQWSVATMRVAKITFILALMLSTFLVPTFALIQERGTGLCYGKDHAYFLTAPSGWILDTESGASQGIFATFYPKGSDWDGPVVMYSNAAGREGLSPEAAVNRDVQSLRDKSPKLKVSDAEALETKDKKPVLVRYFTGDNHGNYEAAAYVMEKNIVANLVLTARNQAQFDSALPAFRNLVTSYRFLSDDPSKLDLPALAKAEQIANSTAASTKKDVHEVEIKH